MLAQAVLLLPIAALGVKLAGLRRMQAVLARARDSVSPPRAHPATVARMVSIAQRHGPYRARCLAAALTLQAILRRSGLDAQLRLGVRKRDGRLEAHAWIEHEGVALMEAHDVRQHFDAFDAAIGPSPP